MSVKYNVVLVDKTMGGKRKVLEDTFEATRKPFVNQIIDMVFTDNEDGGDLMEKAPKPEPYTIISVIEPIANARPGIIIITQTEVEI